MVIPSEVDPNETVTFKIVGDEPKIDLETGNIGTLARWNDDRWTNFYFLVVASPVEKPSYLPWKSDQAIAGVGKNDIPLEVRIPPVGAGRYWVQFSYEVLLMRPGPMRHGSYLLCGSILVR